MKSQFLTPVPFHAVQVDDAFWKPRIDANRKVTIPAVFRQCEETGRIANFARAAGRAEGTHEGYFFNDSDVYKAIEGAALALHTRPDPELDKYLDDLIELIAAAQEDDGYLNTYYQLKEPDKKWSNIRDKHELYCAGHLIEAGLAHHAATGKRALLDVAVRFADLIEQVFGPGRRHDAPGHEEIEIALIKLYHHSGEQRYFDLAKFFLEQRGRTEGRETRGVYNQDHKPVTEQDEAVGHAVRAGYLYMAMADVVLQTGAPAYRAALDKLWQNVVSRKSYITGSIGATSTGEAFSDAYDLPNESAYAETCAGIANALWNHRMGLIERDAKYADVLERVLYNGFLSGISLSGDRFFYVNPLASDLGTERLPWFTCACCPPNIERMLELIPGMVYAHDDEAVYVNLYIAGDAQIRAGGSNVALRQFGNYPWDGDIRIEIRPESEGEFELFLRIPGWARHEAFPGDLYKFADAETEQVRLAVNDEPVELDLQKGYARLRRTWQPGDTVRLILPMTVRRIVANEKLEADRGRVALQRGPLVYCAEAIDNAGDIRRLVLVDDVKLEAERRPDLLGGVTVLRGFVPAKSRGEDDAEKFETVPFMAVPYYAWANREKGAMAVWLPRDPALALLPASPTLASTSRVTASHCYGSDSVAAVNDQREPKSSSDESIPRLTFWPHRGTSEWVQLDLPERASIAGVELYWFDDGPSGGCRVPKEWRLLARDGQQWRPAGSADPFGVKKDSYNVVTFDPFETDGLRIEIVLQPEYSAGVLEWRLR